MLVPAPCGEGPRAPPPLPQPDKILTGVADPADPGQGGAVRVVQPDWPPPFQAPSQGPEGRLAGKKTNCF